MLSEAAGPHGSRGGQSGQSGVVYAWRTTVPGLEYPLPRDRWGLKILSLRWKTFESWRTFTPTALLPFRPTFSLSVSPAINISVCAFLSPPVRPFFSTFTQLIDFLLF